MGAATGDTTGAWTMGGGYRGDGVARGEPAGGGVGPPTATGGARGGAGGVTMGETLGPYVATGA